MATESRSWALERRRAQASPTATLVAVAVIGMGLSLHATVLTSVAPTPDHDVASPTLDRVSDAITSAGVAAPERLDTATAAGPDGYELQVTLSTDGRTWTVGPVPPRSSGGENGDRTETATQRVAVRTGPGSVDAGRLRVVIWR